jgi:predicted lipid-binding transport protein (Tim44 family)
MATHVLELLILAGFALFLINKLFSVLGTADEELLNKSGNFRDQKTIKNIEGEIRDIKTERDSGEIDLDEKLIVVENKQELIESLEKVLELMPAFDLNIFLKGAKNAILAILQLRDDESEIEALVDKRYITTFNEISGRYLGPKLVKQNSFEVRVSELYVFGNNVFAKVLVSGVFLDGSSSQVEEEWTFTKNALLDSPEWHLSNID